VKPVLFICVLVAALAGAGAARSDGLPVLGVDVGQTGVASSPGGVRYVTVPAGRDTVVERVVTRGGRIAAWALVHGSFTIPAVAYDASASGLSADGSTLVLITPRTSFPRASTPLMLLDAHRLRVRSVVTLDGDFSFDAISPHGALAYLIQYTSPVDPTRYLVRAFDLRSRRLVPAPVTDPRERSDKMRGNPLTRALSPDGRWAYTLYDGAGATPFVHALDTTARTAHCIDLPSLRHSNALWSLRFHLDSAAHTLMLAKGATPVLAIDSRTFATTGPPATAASAAPRTGVPWLLVALSLGGALAVAGLAVGVRRAIRPSRTPARAS
jgi:hypothetical protein